MFYNIIAQFSVCSSLHDSVSSVTPTHDQPIAWEATEWVGCKHPYVDNTATPSDAFLRGNPRMAPPPGGEAYSQSSTTLPSLLPARVAITNDSNGTIVAV